MRLYCGAISVISAALAHTCKVTGRTEYQAKRIESEAVNDPREREGREREVGGRERQSERETR